ncbi:hypothetical protein BDW66DRAFT_130693 [Aspergillus desertorum]
MFPLSPAPPDSQEVTTACPANCKSRKWKQVRLALQALCSYLVDPATGNLPSLSTGVRMGYVAVETKGKASGLIPYSLWLACWGLFCFFLTSSLY